MKILHVLSQRPGRTGSGVTLTAVVREAAAAGHVQQAVVGVPAGPEAPEVGGLPGGAVHRVTFAAGPGHATGPDRPDLAFPVPGMSDVMPYPSSVWSRLDAGQLAAYREVWRRRLAAAVAGFAPDVIHSHHVWLVSALLKDVAPEVPVVTTCHSTGLRQLELTPHLADEVITGCRRNDRFCVLRDDHGTAIGDALGVGPERIRFVGAGYADHVFKAAGGGAERAADDVVYVGKYSHAKGLPWLLEAWADLRRRGQGGVLHIAGDGAGPEAEALRERMAGHDDVVMHGQLDQPALAALMRRCGVAVLPSFYEGVPLVLVEAAASGCRVVSTALPGVVERIAPALAGRLHLVPLPRLENVDRPVAADLPRFTADLSRALGAALGAGPPAGDLSAALDTFTWRAVFARVEDVWAEVAASPGI